MTADQTPPRFTLETFPVGPLRCNCSIVADRTLGEAWVIDPGGDADRILARLEAQGLRVTRILHTHAHFDHFLASGELRERTGAPLALHPEDRPLWDRLPDQCRFFGIEAAQAPPPDQELAHEETLALGDAFQGTVLHTPGHTPGSACFVLPQLATVITGDTLFRRLVGRTDLWGGDADTLARSIRERLYPLAEQHGCDFTAIPGHGQSTTLSEERAENPYIRAAV